MESSEERTALVARGRLLFEERRRQLRASGEPPATPLQRSPAEPQPTPITGGWTATTATPTATQVRTSVPGTPVAAMGELRPLRAALPDAVIADAPHSARAATPAAPVGSAQAFLLEAVSAPRSARESSDAADEEGQRRAFCEHLGAFQALLEEARELDLRKMQGHELAPLHSAFVGLLAHGRLLAPLAHWLLDRLELMQSREAEMQRRADAARADAERAERKIEVYRKRCAAASEEAEAAAIERMQTLLAESSEMAARSQRDREEVVSRARAERDELRQSLGFALEQMAAEKEAAERRATLAEAALQQRNSVALYDAGGGGSTPAFVGTPAVDAAAALSLQVSGAR